MPLLGRRWESRCEHVAGSRADRPTCWRAVTKSHVHRAAVARLPEQLVTWEALDGPFGHKCRRPCHCRMQRREAHSGDGRSTRAARPCSAAAQTNRRQQALSASLCISGAVRRQAEWQGRPCSAWRQPHPCVGSWGAPLEADAQEAAAEAAAPLVAAAAAAWVAATAAAWVAAVAAAWVAAAAAVAAVVAALRRMGRRTRSTGPQQSTCRRQFSSRKPAAAERPGPDVECWRAVCRTQHHRRKMARLTLYPTTDRPWGQVYE